MDKRQSLVVPVSEQEILLALNGISDMKAPRIDGYGDRFFKESWQTIKGDVNAIEMDFFENERLYKDFNSMVVTLIPKSEEAASIKHLNPIVGYTTLYKIISKVLIGRLGKVIGSIVGLCQDAFVPWQHIHNHILLAYELIKG